MLNAKETIRVALIALANVDSNILFSLLIGDVFGFWLFGLCSGNYREGSMWLAHRFPVRTIFAYFGFAPAEIKNFHVALVRFRPVRFAPEGLRPTSLEYGFVLAAKLTAFPLRTSHTSALILFGLSVGLRLTAFGLLCFKEFVESFFNQFEI